MNEMDRVVYRDALRSDALLISKVYENVAVTSDNVSLFDSIGGIFSPLNKSDVGSRIIDDASYNIVADLEGEIIGYITADSYVDDSFIDSISLDAGCVFDVDNFRTCYVLDTIVQRKFMSMGVGKGLKKALKDELVRCGYDRVIFEIYHIRSLIEDSNTVQIDLYNKPSLILNGKNGAIRIGERELLKSVDGKDYMICSNVFILDLLVR